MNDRTDIIVKTMLLAAPLLTAVYSRCGEMGLRPALPALGLFIGIALEVFRE